MNLKQNKYYKLKDVVHKSALLFSNNKLIVPKSCRQNMLGLIDNAHFGIEKCKNRALEIFYSPGISNDIEE